MRKKIDMRAERYAFDSGFSWYAFLEMLAYALTVLVALVGGILLGWRGNWEGIALATLLGFVLFVRQDYIHSLRLKTLSDAQEFERFTAFTLLLGVILMWSTVWVIHPFVRFLRWSGR